MAKKMLFCFLALMLWSCSSNNEEPTMIDDSIISLDTAPSEYQGYVYKYNDLDYDYLLSLGFTQRCEYATVPQDTMKLMTTEALAQCCLFWPVCGNHIYYPNGRFSIYDGLLISFEHCNALQELAKREQGAIALLKLYKYLKYKEFEYQHNWYETDISKLNDKRHKQHLELLFTTEYFTPKLNKDMLVLLAEKAEDFLLKDVDTDGSISWYNARYTFILWQRVLLCYDKFTSLLSEKEKNIFNQNIKWFGMEIEGLDLTQEYSSLISEKVRLMYEDYHQK